MKWIATLSLVLTGCARSQAVLRDTWTESGPPSYVDHVDGYAFGLIGAGRFNLGQICMDQTPVAIRQGLTAPDVLFTLVSLGIYSPTTIKVWCEDVKR